MTLSFENHLTNAANVHASEIQLRRGEDGQDSLVAMVRGDAVLMATLDQGAAETFLGQAFAVCDGAESYAPGIGRMMRLTGERLELPKGVSQVLMQFMAAGGARRLVSRISYEGDVCCGSCGGG
ncbi:hypothetical protein [Magnetospirillum sp. 64-120]|uniref:hypothetical protein n=1 Tax=Magnetospirillum sp. 64-120 TaxID=1895778 RepID=UPI0009265C7F|nr:hypothetical protein [Magnetospirillum sp. 64-120]OJX70336.1 MAG: hypothetical protein BGO92_17245 [Magnetospirillum sp. 64-120]